MSELYTAHTGSGKVTITEANVILDRPGGMESETVPRSTITRVDAKTIVLSVFGMGGARDLVIYSSDGRHLTLHLVKPKDAKAILALLR